MLAGYPGAERILGNRSIDWGLFTCLGIARTVTTDQITWAAEREYEMPIQGIPSLPRNADLGGISGGPLLMPVPLVQAVAA